jgi:pyruvate dehydrogenase (quinone)
VKSFGSSGCSSSSSCSDFFWILALAYKDGPVVVDAVVDPYAVSLPSHVPLHTAAGYTLSLAKQVLAGRFDDVIKTMERNVRLV